MFERRLFRDRRRGRDRRATPRRQAISTVPAEHRRVVDRRRGGEQRSTLERRGRGARRASVETAAEHIRNALQLLPRPVGSAERTDERGGGLDAAVQRLRLALTLIEHRAP